MFRRMNNLQFKFWIAHVHQTSCKYDYLIGYCSQCHNKCGRFKLPLEEDFPFRGKMSLINAKNWYNGWNACKGCYIRLFVVSLKMSTKFPLNSCASSTLRWRNLKTQLHFTEFIYFSHWSTELPQKLTTVFVQFGINLHKWFSFWKTHKRKLNEIKEWSS